ncbi:ABC transporter permease [Mesorhizobium australicum]|uniref:Monosaccharide ABC transporter membrane protein, CUT2 family (TC 3.A.1.2.-) n=1 Tax=Mesorhizobium australicum TaxID=536018 RepID=A0A1X7N0M7_9HYPH|nr:SMP-30/gluconolactonase/LRE family protein [Mesorhizobium australicum]SMH30822.1 monosaccharide ABC transporter membrane protein, CUT2 family (TC 3.A.1.2.-) [Mesorhizobium australicum]
MSLSESYSRWRYKLVPDHVVGEILAKPWIDNAIPTLLLGIVVVSFAILMSGYFTSAGLSDVSRVFGENLFIAIGLAIVIMAGGIDLSIGSTLALCNLAALALINNYEMPLVMALPIVLAIGGLVGLVNGIAIGYLRLRAFLTTLVTLIFVRSLVELLLQKYPTVFTSGFNQSAAWEFMAVGIVYGIPGVLIFALVAAVILHVVLTRTRFGWHVMAVGGSRRSAYNAGIHVRRTVCLTYVISGVMVGIAACFYAARQLNAGSDVGLGLEFTVLTAVVLGGVSLGGGRGSIVKAVLGTIIVVLVQNALIRMGLRSGASSTVLGCILLLAVAIDVRWLKNRHKVLSRAYVSPTYFRLPPLPETAFGSSSPYAMNDKLKGVEAIGLGDLDGPEDMVLDWEENVYCGSRHGDIIRFFAPDYKRWEVFAHIGGTPLGMACDAQGNIYSCVAGMGLYKITPDPAREVVKLTDETNRSRLSVIDDTRLRLADDLDIAPDGRIFFSEATVRYEVYEWMVDALEARGNGRIICYDPRDNSTKTVVSNLQLPNGICVERNGQSLLFAETWGCRITRWWFDGPKKGQSEIVIDNLPGYPDNINRGSDGTYWCALTGMRSAAFDVAMRFPKFRRRMVLKIPPDEWLYPNMNTGCVIRFDEQGNVLDCLWDLGGEAHPMLTSIREHKGKLFLGGAYNNRIGRYTIPGADQNWVALEDYWGKKS